MQETQGVVYITTLNFLYRRNVLYWSMRASRLRVMHRFGVRNRFEIRKGQRVGEVVGGGNHKYDF
jgi:hypothetical protein